MSVITTLDRPVVGMVHLPPPPGAPDYGGDRERVRERALEDAEALAAEKKPSRGCSIKFREGNKPRYFEA